MKEFDGKKLLVLGGNPETVPLVEIANSMGIKTIVVSARHSDVAKQVCWKPYDIDGMDVEAVIDVAKKENVDGVLVGVADILVPSYCKVCDALGFPCYATQKIVDIFSFKDSFKKTCESFGIHGVPEFKLDTNFKQEDLDRIQYPVMVKPIDGGGGVGLTVANNESELRQAVDIALNLSKKKKFIVEKFMTKDDTSMYYTFKDGLCSVSCVFDRLTTNEQPGKSSVCLGSIYPSKFIEDYFKNMHANAINMFKEIGIKNGILMFQAFYENGQFYVYDPGFRLQGEAPHLHMKAIHGFDQREMLIRFALTGSEGDIDLTKEDDVLMRGKFASTLWILLKEGTIAKIEGLDAAREDPEISDIVQRLNVGDSVLSDWVGTEKQVLCRIYIQCSSKRELADKLKYYQRTIKVFDTNNRNMVLKGFDVDAALS